MLHLLAKQLSSVFDQYNSKKIINIFQNFGYTVTNNFILPLPDCVINNIALFVKDFDDKLTIDDIVIKYEQFNSLKHSDELKWIIVLSQEYISYYWKKQVLMTISLYPDKTVNQTKKRLIEILRSMISIVSKRSQFDAKRFVDIYGKYSLFYAFAYFKLSNVSEYDQQYRVNDQFLKWKNNFNGIYNHDDLTKDLFFKHAYLLILIRLVLINNFISISEISLTILSNLENWLSRKKLPYFNFEYFKWSTTDIHMLNILYLGLRPLNTQNNSDSSQRSTFGTDDIFRTIYQQMISTSTRHHLGEFYTPPELAQLMIENAYSFGDLILDPACGSGTILVEIINHIRNHKNKTLLQINHCLDNIFGFDINPIAVATTVANILLQRKDYFNLDNSFLPSIKHFDVFAFESIRDSIKKFDVVIGNPPWLVLSGIKNKIFKQRIKTLAQELKIEPEAKHAPNIEISSIFLHRVKLFLKTHGKLNFIVSNAFITGDNHARTRQFQEFDHIQFWKFTTDIFQIHSICLFARYQPKLIRSYEDLKNLIVEVKIIDVKKDVGGKMLFTTVKLDTYKPYKVEKKSKSIMVGRFISTSEQSILLPLGTNYYKKKFFMGASLIPRNLIFIKPEAESLKQHIRTFRHIIFNNAKSPWKFDPLDKLHLINAKVEKKFIFQCVKSTDIVPFVSLRTWLIFLLIEPEKSTSGYQLTKDKSSLGWKYFQKLDSLFIAHLTPGAGLTNLWANINYQTKLTTSRQRSPIKVVMMASGTLVKACLIRDKKIIIDTTNYFMGVESEDEAYYLLSFLNTPTITKVIQQIQAEGAGGKGRHIHKRPFEIKLPKFDSKNPIHIDFALFSKYMEKKAHKVVKDWIQKEKIKLLTKRRFNNSQKVSLDFIVDTDVIRPLTIQNHVYNQLGWNTKNHQLSGDYLKLDKLYAKLTTSTKNL